ncbi:MAG: outer membrane protein transport protein, partial [Pseudomonadota bacterium]
KHTLEGDLTFDLDSAGVGAALSGVTGAFVDGRAETDLDMPSQLGFGLRYDVPDTGLTLAANAWRTGWSSYDELRVEFANPAQADDVTTGDWNDVWAYSIGAEFAASDRLTARIGAMRDDSPTPDATRSPRIPDNDRTWIAGGVTYHLSPSASATLSGAQMFVKDAEINLTPAAPENAFRGNLSGVSEASAKVVSVQITFRR